MHKPLVFTPGRTVKRPTATDTVLESCCADTIHRFPFTTSTPPPLAQVIFLCLIISGQIFSAEKILANETAGNEMPKLATLCEQCHGHYANPIYSGNPTLAGMDKTLLRRKLEGHRSAQIDGTMMSRVAIRLTDEEIEQIAEYYSTLKPTLNTDSH